MIFFLVLDLWPGGQPRKIARVSEHYTEAAFCADLAQDAKNSEGYRIDIDKMTIERVECIITPARIRKVYP